MMKSHIMSRAHRDAALCIPLYEQSRVIRAIFPELASFQGGILDTAVEVIEAYAVCVQVQTALHDSQLLLAKYLQAVYAQYQSEHPIRYWFIGDVIPLDSVLFVVKVDLLFRELFDLKVKYRAEGSDLHCIRTRITAVQRWLRKIVKLYAEMQVSIENDTVAYLTKPSSESLGKEDGIIVDLTAVKELDDNKAVEAVPLK